MSVLVMADESDKTRKERSIIEALKAPVQSELSRKRKVASNLPHDGKRYNPPKTTGNPKNISVQQRLQEFKGEEFKESGGKLFCTACREELGTKKTVIQQHIKSSKHETGKTKLKDKISKQTDIAEVILKYDKEVHPKGESLSMEHRVYRLKVVRTFLKAGIPMNKIDQFRNILEENGYSLTHSSHLTEIIDVISKEHREAIKKTISGKYVSVIFDGTTHVVEALNIILRFVTESPEWKVEQRLVRLLLVAKAMTGEGLAQQLMTTLSTNLGINSALLLAAMRDRASVNDVAVRHLKVLYPNVVDIGCFSHTLDHVGENMATPLLDSFVKSWISLFVHSPRARIGFQTQTGQRPKSYSATRWWSKFEVIKQIHDLFGDIPNFLNGQDLPEVTKRKLLQIINDPQQLAILKMQLAATVDAMEPFVKATYNLEGDGPLALRTYQELRTVEASMATANYPNITALARNFAGINVPLKQQWIDYSIQCIQPAYQYYHNKFTNGPLQHLVLIFKACRLFDPVKVNEMQPNAASIDELRCIPFLDSDLIIQSLQHELPTYLALTDGIANDFDVLQWWSRHSQELPAWSKECKNILLMQPSSAASERVFSLLQNSFSHRQERVLEDYIEASIMLQYNEK